MVEHESCTYTTSTKTFAGLNFHSLYINIFNLEILGYTVTIKFYSVFPSLLLYTYSSPPPSLSLTLPLSLSPVITDQLADKYNLPLKSGFNNTRGFYLQLFTGNTAVRKGKGRGQRKDSAVGMTADQLPAEFIKVARLKNTLSFTTMDLIKLNSELLREGRREREGKGERKVGRTGGVIERRRERGRGERHKGEKWRKEE